MGLFGWLVTLACNAGHIDSFKCSACPAGLGKSVQMTAHRCPNSTPAGMFRFLQTVSYTLRTNQTGASNMLPAWNPESLEVSTATEI
jgi:hypothetical protein